jgi:hypothetical protein
MPRNLAQAARDYYEKAVREQVLNEYRAYLAGEEYEKKFLQEYRLQWENWRENEPGLPDEVYAAYLFYVKHFNDEDIGGDAVFQFPVTGRDVYAVRTTTDGDDTWVELYDARGKFLAAARTELDVVAWGDRDWLRAQVAHTAEYPPELRAIQGQSIWGQPLEGFHCMATRKHKCNASPPGRCIERAGHLQAENSPHRCSRCGFTWGGQPRPAPAPPPPEPEVVPWVVRVYSREYTSGSFVYTLKDTPITLITKKGKRTIPVADVRQITFALRDPDTGAIKGRRFDTVRTARARLTGTLEGDALHTHNPLMPSQNLWFAEMKKLVAMTKKQARDYFTFDAPDTLFLEGGCYGRRKRFRVVGSTEGQVFGMDLYAVNSSLAAAAVHAGLARPGKRAVVEVEILASPAHFKGSTRNGVTSEPADQFALGAFRFVEPEQD